MGALEITLFKKTSGCADSEMIVLYPLKVREARCERVAATSGAPKFKAQTTADRA
ncbi:hypothetical protein [uncultured Campylobacter sp.]|uniref:hypothetical protein n=1 Tax=uncultured Campylobacter sp. TaxID=218934 RepID=UPI002609F918|nr:hypothetical protein [uncultured Campylobacter sp.]